MPVKRENKLYSLATVTPDLQAHETNLSVIENAIREIESNYSAEIAKIEDNFGLFAAENRKTYERYEEDYAKILGFVDQEYEGLFKALDEDFVAHREKLDKQLADEDSEYQGIIRAFDDLKADAFKTYQEMCSKSEVSINKETEIHQKFVDEKNADFEATKEKYSLINNKQYDTLLWTMEKTKNALNALTKSLNEQAFNDTKFANQAVMQIIESLRETKNKITALFKTTTLGYANKKSKIDELSEIRQIPYSEINQTLIDQYVRQIASVNTKKVNFDKMVQEDYLKSTMIIGRKIIEADAQKDHRLTRKYILQYGLIKSKSNYLLKRNQELSDLLISKYQNEISKIKVESFKRVEEIKLAYSMPSRFFQNSVNLYSNFAFYVSESLDEIDNMLSDLIRFNQNITQTFVDYMKSSAKTFEDYKINCLVTVNNVTSRMTDLITGIDRYSKDIVSLESHNRLEIAEVKKQMENADITGDYQKYLAQLEYDKMLADFQHSVNIKKAQSGSDGEASLLVIQREVTERNKQRQADEASAKHQRLITNLEKDIHEQAYDKELALIEARYRHDLALIDLQEKRTLEDEAFAARHQNYLLGQTFASQKEIYEGNKSAGSAFVVDFVHETQHLIDLHKAQTSLDEGYLVDSETPRAYAYLLEIRRERILEELRYQTGKQTEPHDKAIRYFNHLLYMNRANIQKQIGKYALYVKHLLVNLTEANAPIQAESLSLEHFYRYDILSVIKNSRETVASLISPEQNAALFERATRILDEDFKKVAILTTGAEKDSLMNVRSSKGLKKILLSFYVEMLLLLEGFQDHVAALLDALEECLIRNDVLAMKKYQDESERKKRILEAEFDEAVFQASKRKIPLGKALENLSGESRMVETSLADRVYQLNKTYLEGLKEQENGLKRLDRRLAKEDKKNIRVKTSVVDRNRKAAERQKRLLELEQKRYVAGYESQKKKNYVAALEENNQTAYDLTVLNKTRVSGVETLNQTIATLPKKNELFVLNLEAEKDKFAKERKEALMRELSRIEEQKFVSRPAFLTRMGEIRERLPQDYVGLYREIAAAQTDYLKEFQSANDLYTQEFNRFLNNQVEYNSILFNDSIILHPYEKFLSVSDKIKNKTDEVFKDTQNKSQTELDSLKKTAVDSEENQKRIINA